MKRSMAFLLMVVICVGLVACSIGDTEKENESDRDSSGVTVAEDESENSGEDGNAAENKVFILDEVKSFATVVDLTTDNWEDYFEIKEIEEITPPDFEDEEPEIERDLYVKLKKENSFAIDTVMRFSFSEAMTHNSYDSTTKEQISSSPGNYREEEDTLDAEAIAYPQSIGTLGMTGTYTYRKYEHQGVIYESILHVKDIKCLKVTGTILLLDIPEDAWNNTRYGENMPCILYEKDGEECVIMKEGMERALKDIFFPES